MPSGLSQSHQEIAGQFQRELLQLICLGSGGQHVQRPLPRGMGRPIGLQCPCNSFTRQEVRGASDSTNQRIENNALVSSSGITGGARRVVYLVVSYSPVRWRGGAAARAARVAGDYEGRAKKKKPQTHVHLPDRASKKYLPTFFSFFFFFSKKFLLRFCVFLGMGNPETAKNLFWKFFGHDPKVHHMTQKNIFLGTCSVRSWPY